MSKDRALSDRPVPLSGGRTNSGAHLAARRLRIAPGAPADGTPQETQELRVGAGSNLTLIARGNRAVRFLVRAVCPIPSGDAWRHCNCMCLCVS